jgi:hypothetical protein
MASGSPFLPAPIVSATAAAFRRDASLFRLPCRAISVRPFLPLQAIPFIHAFFG